MATAALITWLLTAVVGFALLAMWMSKGGHRRGSDPASRFRPALIFGHLVLAASGLIVWIAYVMTDSARLAWTAVALLGVVALLGFTMFAIWMSQVRNGRAAATAERQFPVSVVFGHGALAATTLVLALLAALSA